MSKTPLSCSPPMPTSSELSMALTPIGPFCPFRSRATIDMEPRMDKIQENVPDFADEFRRVQEQMMLGQTPDPGRLRQLADDINLAVDQWEGLLTRLCVTPDFQTKEYAKLTEAHLNCHGISPQTIASLLRWQSGCMRSLADGTPPPMPPPDLDLQAIMEQSQKEQASGSNNKTPSISAMQAAEQITAHPFDPATLESSPEIQKEYKKLIMEHSSLIEFGANYDDFDPVGKIAFLEQIEAVEERWDTFFFRFKIMNQVNEEYSRQCEAFLASMKLTEDEYRELLKESHRLMRVDAEMQRDRML